MPSKFDDILGEEENNKNTVNGIFSCNVCALAQSTAEYDEKTNSVKWTCRKGHENEAELQ